MTIILTDQDNWRRIPKRDGFLKMTPNTPEIYCAHYAINKSAFLYTASMHSQIDEICFPLKTYLNIDHFGYMKFLEDGRILVLTSGQSNARQWCSHYFTNMPPQAKEFSQFVLRSPTNKPFCSLFPENPLEAIYQSLYNYNLRYGFIIAEKIQTHCEVFAFAFKCESGDKSKFFLEHIAYLFDFINYFRQRAKAIIDCKDKSKLAIQKHKLKLNPSNSIIDNEHNKFVNYLIQHCKTEHGLKSLSAQEYRCLELLSRGKTMKEAGIILNISSRTVEGYLNRIKNKTGLCLKSQLTDLFYDFKNTLFYNSAQ